MSDKSGAALAKLTTGTQWELILRSHFPTADHISCRWEDVCFGLAGVTDPLAALILQVKYVGQDGYVKKLESEIVKFCQKLAHDENWLKRNYKDPTGPMVVAHQRMIQKLSRLAVYEILAPGVCPQCKGQVSVILSNGQKVICDACSGTGDSEYKMRERCRIAKIDVKSWSRVRGEQYRELYYRLIGKEREALRTIYDRVFKYHVDEGA